ncbi:SCO family protein [Piscinibacter sp.]|uniref:SCO family protein n=1 Tax=Piscinibacter sp. TaxID=1903157 RepID=UPI002CACF508|nr:SCO family protein [Albitalea sp.]HUG25396.1 SCO family protein [Albitalea sp.]
MMTKSLLVAALSLVLVACGERAGAPPSTFNATDISSVEWGRDFQLLDHHGNRRSLADFNGKVVMLFFGFTHCPDICPTALTDIAGVVEKLGDDGSRVQGLFVTVDPKRDTPPVLARYVSEFHPSFLGLHADELTIAALAKEFKFFYGMSPAPAEEGYDVSHGSAIYVYDPQGHLRLLIDNTDRTVDAMVADVRLLLNE